MNFNFQFGNRRPDKKQLIILSAVLSISIALFSQCSKIPENNIWDLIDQIQRKYFPGSIVNELIRQDPDKLDRRIDRDVTSAILQYEKWERKNRKINMTNENILKEIKKSKYNQFQKIIVEDAIYYEFPPDGSKAQESLGGTMGIRAVWVE